jgi:regulator of protease activity HflC (stomatin/prohibitin superfamily)
MHRIYAPRIVADHIMTQDDFVRLHKFLLEMGDLSGVSDDLRRVIEDEWPELARKLPPKKPNAWPVGNAISSDGVSLTATMNVRFRLQRNAIPVLHQAVGPDYLQLLLRPGIGSLTREVIAQYTAEQVYSTARQEIQDKIRGLWSPG